MAIVERECHQEKGVDLIAGREVEEWAELKVCQEAEVIADQKAGEVIVDQKVGEVIVDLKLGEVIVDQ